MSDTKKFQYDFHRMQYLKYRNLMLKYASRAETEIVPILKWQYKGASDYYFDLMNQIDEIMHFSLNEG